MLKALLIFVAVIVLYRLFERATRKQTPAAPSRKPQSQTQPQVLSSCPKCGTYFSEAQGVSRAGRVYCCNSCANGF